LADHSSEKGGPLAAGKRRIDQVSGLLWLMVGVLVITESRDLLCDISKCFWNRGLFIIFLAALDQGAEVVIAGRSYGGHLFGALVDLDAPD
jgi:hypothetical protein